MSYSNHKRLALDASRPLAHRASNVRSCAVHVSQKLRVRRSEIIERVLKLSGVDLCNIQEEQELLRGLSSLDSLRFPTLNSDHNQPVPKQPCS